MAALQPHVARCEIVNGSGELEQIYFRFPEYCLLLPKGTRQNLLWEVDRETPGKQIKDFFENVGGDAAMSGEVRRQVQLLKTKAISSLAYQAFIH